MSANVFLVGPGHPATGQLTGSGKTQGFGHSGCSLGGSETPTVKTEGIATCWRLPNGDLHRVDGPALAWDNGRVEYCQYGELHRVDGPAVVWADGTQEWYQFGQLHRVDGPAIKWASGALDWFQRGKRHRVDGPAIEQKKFSHSWWLWGLVISEVEAARVSTLSDDALEVAAGLALDWEGSVTSLLDTAVLLAQ